MTREIAINRIREIERCTPIHTEDDVKDCKALEMAIQALSQVSEIEENIIKYMKKYPNHVGNTDFWEGFYACRNVVLQLDDEEYAPKEQEPCDDAISRADFESHLFENYCVPVSKIGKPNQYSSGCFYKDVVKCLDDLPSVTQKSGKWIPFSERLPKPFEHCLITTTDGEVIYHYDDGHYSKYKAWMPLPEPYKAESEDKE